MVDITWHSNGIAKARALSDYEATRTAISAACGAQNKPACITTSNGPSTLIAQILSDFKDWIV